MSNFPVSSHIKLLPMKDASIIEFFSIPMRLHNTRGVKFSIALILAISKVVFEPKLASTHIKLLPFNICFLDISLNHKSKHICTDILIPFILKTKFALFISPISKNFFSKSDKCIFLYMPFIFPFSIIAAEL